MGVWKVFVIKYLRGYECDAKTDFFTQWEALLVLTGGDGAKKKDSNRRVANIGKASTV
jgi:hypothetical protein